MKRLFALLIIIGMTACSSKPNNENSDSQIVRSATSSLSIALAYLQLGNTAKAEPNLQKALAENPNSGAVYLGYALYYQQLGDFEQAEAAFFQAKQYAPASLIPQDFVTYLCRQGEYESASSHYSSIVSVAGEEVKKALLLDLAECYYKQNRLEKAEEAYVGSLGQQGGSNDKALLRLAELALDEDQSQTALDYLTRFNASKVHVTAESLLLEKKTYEALGLNDKAQQVTETLTMVFPNYFETELPLSVNEASTANSEVKVAEQIESEATEPASAVSAVTQDSQPTPKFHVIEKGETLYRVTRLYSVSLGQLRAWNPNLQVNDISIGTKIYLEDN